MGRSSNSLVYMLWRTLSWENETGTRLGPGARQAWMRTDKCQVSSRASGKTRPNRTMIRQKVIPTAGPVCGDLTKSVRERG